MDERKAAILRAVVEAYIDEAQPVGSSQVAGLPGFDVSAATVRNEMAALEREGFLSQPHTSAGRVPTDQGYRYFVDSLGGAGLLADAEVRQVRKFFSHAKGEIEKRLADTSRLLVDITDYAAVVVGPPNDPATVRSVQLVELAPGHLLVVLVLSDGAVEKRAVQTTEAETAETIARAGAILSAELVGRPIPSDVEVTGADDADAATLLARVADAWKSDAPHGSVHVGGAARMAGQFDAVDTVREVLTILEEQLIVVSLIGDLIERGLSVAIGSETGVEPLADCSVVVAPYTVQGEDAGSIGLLGPTRMDYSKALAAVTVVSHRLGRSLEAVTES